MTTPVTEPAGGLMAGITGASIAAQPSTNSMDKDTFLQLLVAQMRYQDPMNPTDSAQFLAQTAQFTALEKMEAVAEQSAQAVATQMAFGASSLVGRQVTYTNAEGGTTTGAVDAVRFTVDGPVLDVGGTEIALGEVQSVAEGRRTEQTQTDTTTTAEPAAS